MIKSSTRYFSLLLAIGFLFAAFASAQTQGIASKVVVIDSNAFFNDKTGITKIIAASKSVVAEVAARRSEVQQLIQRVDAVSKDIEAMRGNAGKGIPVDEKTMQAKIDELERLRREGKYKEDEYKAFAQKKQNEIVGPVYSEVLKALGEYVTQKDYGLVFDLSKDQNGVLAFASDKFDITKDFITYFNAKPVTTISSVPVK